MSFNVLEILPEPALVLRLAPYLAVGITVGILYFLGLWWVTLRFVQGSPALPTIALMLARGLLLVVALVLASRAGALQLLAIAFGILLARSAMIRHVRKEAP